jgi:hypothetical protein
MQQGDDSHHEIESSVHILPKPMLREFRHIFGEKYLLDMASDAMMVDDERDEDDAAMPQQQQQQQPQQQPQQLPELIAIPTNQRARKDLVAVGEDIEEEKDRLLNVVRDRNQEFYTHLYTLVVEAIQMQRFACLFVCLFCSLFVRLLSCVLGLYCFWRLT